MHQEKTVVDLSSHNEDMMLGEDLVLQALVDCQITLTMNKLLNP